MSDTELTPMPEPVRRLEIFTGSGRRRSWTAEQKGRIVAERLAGGEFVSAVARRHGLTAQQVLAWRRQGRDGVRSARPLGFASVMVAPAALEIEYCGATIRVSASSDGATLQSVLQALKAAS